MAVQDEEEALHDGYRQVLVLYSKVFRMGDTDDLDHIEKIAKDSRGCWTTC